MGREGVLWGSARSKESTVFLRPFALLLLCLRCCWDFLMGVSLREILIKIGFAKSNSDYKRNFQNSAYKINNLLVKNENEILSEIHLNEKIIKISFGKKKHYLIKII